MVSRLKEERVIAVEPTAKSQCCRCNETITADEEGKLPKGTVRRGRSKATLICANCHAAGMKLYRAQVSTTSLERLPAEARARFWKDARSVMGSKISEHTKNIIDKYQEDQFSIGTEAKFMPLKYYTDLGFDPEKSKRR